MSNAVRDSSYNSDQKQTPTTFKDRVINRKRINSKGQLSTEDARKPSYANLPQTFSRPLHKDNPFSDSSVSIKIKKSRFILGRSSTPSKQPAAIIRNPSQPSLVLDKRFSYPKERKNVKRAPSLSSLSFTENKLVASLASNQKIQNITMSPSLNTTLNTSILQMPECEDERSKKVSQDFKHAKVIQSRLMEQLKILSQKTQKPSEDLLANKLELYKYAFGEIIVRNKAYSSVLRVIKDAYEEAYVILAKENNREIIKSLEKDLQDAELKFESSQAEIRSLRRKIEKLAKESVQLSRALDQREKQYTEIHEKLYNITNTSIQNIPKDEEGWKSLVSEIQEYSQVVQSMTNEIRQLRNKEKQLIKLVLALKMRGYPVEEIYETEISKKKSAKSAETNQDISDDEETEPLVKGSPKKVARPPGVPELNLGSIQPELSSGSEDMDSLSEIEV